MLPPCKHNKQTLIDLAPNTISRDEGARIRAVVSASRFYGPDTNRLRPNANPTRKKSVLVSGVLAGNK